MNSKTEDDGGSSACEGRVEISYQDEEDATRTLSIVHFFFFFSLFLPFLRSLFIFLVLTQ